MREAEQARHMKPGLQAQFVRQKYKELPSPEPTQ